MPVDRDLWQSGFSKTGQPRWPCPACNTGTLLLRKDTLHCAPTAETLRDESFNGFDSHSYSGRFSCIFECSRGECREPVAVAGGFGLQSSHLESGKLEEECLPASFHPAPDMIHLPKRCPEDIVKEARAAFALFWCDHASSLNRVRNAIELLLTAMGVKRHGRRSSGGRTRLSLDSRISVLRAARPSLGDLCDRLLAVKHLGNAGSHPNDVERKDVFDGLDILEYVLAERYDNPQGRLGKMVREINRRKGPRREGG